MIYFSKFRDYNLLDPMNILNELSKLILLILSCILIFLNSSVLSYLQPYLALIPQKNTTYVIQYIHFKACHFNPYYEYQNSMLLIVVICSILYFSVGEKTNNVTAIDVTAIVTSFNNDNLLKQVMKDLTKNYQIFLEKIIVVQDGPYRSNLSKFAIEHPQIRFIMTGVKVGQLMSLDFAYKQVKTKYVLHYKEDWEALSQKQNKNNSESKLKTGVTAIVNSFNNDDLLKQVINELTNYKFLDKIIVVQDGPDPSNISKIVSEHPQIQIITTGKKLGQLMSLDFAYKQVQTKFVLHWKQNWKALKQEQIKLLKEKEPVNKPVYKSTHTNQIKNTTGTLKSTNDINNKEGTNLVLFKILIAPLFILLIYFIWKSQIKKQNEFKTKQFQEEKSQEIRQVESIENQEQN